MPSTAPTHAIVAHDAAESPEDAARLETLRAAGVELVQAHWLADSVAKNERLPEAKYRAPLGSDAASEAAAPDGGGDGTPRAAVPVEHADAAAADVQMDTGPAETGEAATAAGAGVADTPLVGQRCVVLNQREAPPGVASTSAAGEKVASPARFFGSYATTTRCSVQTRDSSHIAQRQLTDGEPTMKVEPADDAAANPAAANPAVLP